MKNEDKILKAALAVVKEHTISGTRMHLIAESFEGWRKEIRGMLQKYEPELSDKANECLPYQIVSYLEGATIQYLVDEKRIDLDAYFEFGKKMILTIIEEEVHKLQ